jgi:protease-4
MRELQAEYPDKPLICTGEDMMTSGGYMIATGCDKIYVRPSTVAGSIGVIMASFGFDQAIEKFDVERRVFTAGNNKARIDPFKPLREEDKAKFETMLGNIHQEFIRVVKESRGDKLKGDDEVLFSGDFWTGHEAVELGLVDGIGDLASVMKDEFGVKHAINYSPSPSIFERANKIFSSKVSLDLGDIAGYRMY